MRITSNSHVPSADSGDHTSEAKNGKDAATQSKQENTPDAAKFTNSGSESLRVLSENFSNQGTSTIDSEDGSEISDQSDNQVQNLQMSGPEDDAVILDITGDNIGLHGGDNKDKLQITGDDGYLGGNESNDFLSATGNRNELDGGSGNDIAVVNGNDNTISLGSGNDRSVVIGDNNTIDAGTLEGPDLSPNAIEQFNIIGNSNTLDATQTKSTTNIRGNDNTLKTGANDDVIDIFAGSDNEIYAGGGDDSISVGSVFGPASNNKVYAEAGNDHIGILAYEGTVVDGGDGNDRLQVLLDYEEGMSIVPNNSTSRSPDSPVEYVVRDAEGRIAVTFTNIESLVFQNASFVINDDGGWDLEG